MSVYENVPLVELETELLKYQACWPTVVIGGVAIKADSVHMPSAVQIWATDKQDFKAEIHQSPGLPKDLFMFTRALSAAEGISAIMQILRRQSLDVGGVSLSFEHLRFGRAAFLGARDYDYLYPEELHKHVNGWPKLFFEGGFENQQAIENVYKRLETDLQGAQYKFHTIWDAARHLVGFRAGGGYFRSGLAGALRIPVSLRAKVEERRLDYAVEIPKRLGSLSRRVWYVARSEKGDRDEALALPDGSEQDDLLRFSSSVQVAPGDEVVEVILALDGRRITSQTTWSQRQPAPEISAKEERAEIPSREGRVFIVHGRNHPVRDQIRSYLKNNWNLDTEVMELEPSQGRTLTEKFEQIAGYCKYAIVILTGDDRLRHGLCKSVRRARQNVILELGFFWGRLGRHNLAFLVDTGIELPSDIANVGYIPITRDLAQTKLDLVQELRAAGVIRANAG